MKNKERKKLGLNITHEVFTVNPKEPDAVPSRKSGVLTSRKIDNPGESIRTFTPLPDAPRPTNILSSRTETWPPKKTKMDLSITKTEVIGQRTKTKGELYHFDERRYVALCGIYERIVGNYQAMLNAYTDLGIKKPVDRAKLGQIGFEDLSSIKIDFYNLVEADIEKLDLQTDIVRKTFDVPAVQRWTKFEQSIMSQRNLIQMTLRHESFQHSVELNYLTLHGNNTIEFTEENKNNIRENCSTFIDSQAKKDFINLLKQLENDFDSLREMLQKNGINRIFGYGELISINDQKISISKSIVNLIKK